MPRRTLDHDVFDAALDRLQLVYGGDEGELVKRVLGDQPAVRLLELCQEVDGG